MSMDKFILVQILLYASSSLSLAETISFLDGH